MFNERWTVNGSVFRQPQSHLCGECAIAPSHSTEAEMFWKAPRYWGVLLMTTFRSAMVSPAVRIAS